MRLRTCLGHYLLIVSLKVDFQEPSLNNYYIFTTKLYLENFETVLGT